MIGRRVFNRMLIEISLAVGHCVSRRALWTQLHELEVDPEQMGGVEVGAFCGLPLRRFLAEQGLRIDPLELRQLEQRLRAINPYRADPYDRVDAFERVAI